MTKIVDPLFKYIEAADIIVEPLVKVEKDRYIASWSHVYVDYVQSAEGSEIVNLLDVFEKQKISHFYDEFALIEYKKQKDLPCIVITTDRAPGLLCSGKPPEDLQRFCGKNARPWDNLLSDGGLTNKTCELIVYPDDFTWTLAVNTKNYFFAYAPFEIDLEYCRKHLY